MSRLLMKQFNNCMMSYCHLNVCGCKLTVSQQAVRVCMSVERYAQTLVSNEQIVFRRIFMIKNRTVSNVSVSILCRRYHPIVLAVMFCILCSTYLLTLSR